MKKPIPHNAHNMADNNPDAFLAGMTLSWNIQKTRIDKMWRQLWGTSIVDEHEVYNYPHFTASIGTKGSNQNKFAKMVGISQKVIDQMMNDAFATGKVQYIEMNFNKTLRHQDQNTLAKQYFKNRFNGITKIELDAPIVKNNKPQPTKHFSDFSIDTIVETTIITHDFWWENQQELKTEAIVEATTMRMWKGTTEVTSQYTTEDKHAALITFFNTHPANWVEQSHSVYNDGQFWHIKETYTGTVTSDLYESWIDAIDWDKEPKGKTYASYFAWWVLHYITYIDYGLVYEKATSSYIDVEGQQNTDTIIRWLKTDGLKHSDRYDYMQTMAFFSEFRVEVIQQSDGGCCGIGGFIGDLLGGFVGLFDSLIEVIADGIYNNPVFNVLIKPIMEEVGNWFGISDEKMDAMIYQTVKMVVIAVGAAYLGPETAYETLMAEGVSALTYSQIAEIAVDMYSIAGAQYIGGKQYEVAMQNQQQRNDEMHYYAYSGTMGSYKEHKSKDQWLYHDMFFPLNNLKFAHRPKDNIQRQGGYYGITS